RLGQRIPLREGLDDQAQGQGSARRRSPARRRGLRRPTRGSRSMSYVGRSEAERKRMLETLGIRRFEDLLRDVPEALRTTGPLDVPGPLSEIEVRAHVGELASTNDSARGALCFLG